MPKWKIVFDKNLCIGNGVCAALDPKTWKQPVSEVNGGDGKAHIIGGNKLENGAWEEIEADDLGNNMAAAEACPVNAIHIINKETGEQII